MPDRSSARYTRAEAAVAFSRAVGSTEGIAGENEATDFLDLHADECLPEGDGPFTREQLSAAWNEAADLAKEHYNPEDGETSDTVRCDTAGDLAVELALGYLEDPRADADSIIAAAWAGLADVDLDEHRVWNQHSNGLGDWCPWSGEEATAENREALFSGLSDDDESCPQACPGSWLEEPEPGDPAHDAAIVATVTGWLA